MRTALAAAAPPVPSLLCVLARARAPAPAPAVPAPAAPAAPAPVAPAPAPPVPAALPVPLQTVAPVVVLPAARVAPALPAHGSGSHWPCLAHAQRRNSCLPPRPPPLAERLPLQSPPFFTDHEGVDSICGSFVSGSTDAVLFYVTSQCDAYAVELNPGIVPVPRNYGEAIMDPIYGAISRSLVLLYGPRPLSGARRAAFCFSIALGRLVPFALCAAPLAQPCAARRPSASERGASRSLLLFYRPWPPRAVRSVRSASRAVLLDGPRPRSGACHAQPCSLRPSASLRRISMCVACYLCVYPCSPVHLCALCVCVSCGYDEPRQANLAYTV
jgi:hypothetical protein